MSDRKPKIEQRIVHQFGRAVLLFCVALLQTSLAPTVWRFRADWVLIFVICWALLRGLVPGLRWAIYGGLALDILGILPLGTHLLALLLCVLLLVALTEPLDREQPLLMMACVLGTSLLYNATLAFVQSIMVGPLPWSSYMLLVVVPTTLLNTIVAVPVFALLRRVDRRGRPFIEAEV